MQLSDFHFKMSRNGWHRRLQVYTFGKNVPEFPNLCPHFWLTIVCIFVSPFKFVPLTAFKMVWVPTRWTALKVWVPTRWTALKVWVPTKLTMCMMARVANNSLRIFFKGVLWTFDHTVIAAFNDAFPAIKRAAVWTLKLAVKIVSLPFKAFGYTLYFSFMGMERTAIQIEKTCVYIYRSPWSPLRPIRWFFRSRYTQMVIDGNEKMLYQSVKWLDKWLDQTEFFTSNIWDFNDEEWEKFEREFYLDLAKRKQYGSNYRKTMDYWSYIQSCRMMHGDSDWEKLAGKTIKWSDYLEERRLEKERARKQFYTNLAMGAQSIFAGIKAVAKVSAYIVTVAFLSLAIGALGYLVYEAVPIIMAAVTSFFQSTSTKEIAWGICQGVLMVLIVVATGYVSFRLGVHKALMYLWRILVGVPLIHIGKGLRFVIGKPMIRIAKSITKGTSFFVLYLKVAKENQCPGIEWED